MALIEDVTKMKSEGYSDDEISQRLSSQGLSPQTINEAIAQSNIKSEVSKPEDIKDPSAFFEKDKMTEGENMEAMQPSMITQQPAQATQDYGEYQDQQAQQQYPQEYQQEYQQQYQQQYSQGISADTISEIAEQVVSQSLSSIKSSVEKAIDLKTVMESKMDSLNERLTRIEKIIDRLQLSILQKVGDYTNNIEDIKNELIETQKTFKAMSEKHMTRHHSKN